MAAQALKRLNGLRDTITEICSISGTPGLSFGVLHEDHVLHTENFGYADIEAQIPPSSETRYAIGSLTKAFTAAAVGRLVEDGKLTWDSLVRDVMGEGFHFSDPGLTQRVSVLDILSHRMGIQRSNQLWHGNDNLLLLDKADVIPHVQYLSPVQQYNTTVHYNNWGYALAGQLVEKVSGEGWASYIQEHLLLPLQMNRTDCKAGLEDAKPYTFLDNHTFHTLPPPTVQDGSIMHASQSIRSSVNDMLKWCRALIKAYTDEQETGQTGSADSPLKQLSRMMSECTPFAKPFGPRSSYGMGWVQAQLPTILGAVGCNPGFVKSMPIVGKDKDLKVFYHQGSMAGYTTSVFLIPSTQSAIVVLTNSLSLNDAADWIGQAILEALLDVEEPNDYVEYAKESASAHLAKFPAMRKSLEAQKILGTEPKQLDAYEGKYYNAIGNFYINIVRCQQLGCLQLAFQGLASQAWRLEHYHHDQFLWLMSRNEAVSRARFPYSPEKLYKLDFQTDDCGEVDSLLWAHDADGPPERFYKVPPGASRQDAGAHSLQAV
ncbi:MAG: hypothetical protein L6R36_006142 [Xanthoria steineri]|nr:MAG: hypothetical protein L6R36_006142 [Xanthoria steineri]